jgi:hypothetical protein
MIEGFLGYFIGLSSYVILKFNQIIANPLITPNNILPE